MLLSLCARDLGGSVPMQMSTERLREGGVAVPDWWRQEAATRVADLDLRQERLAEMVAQQMNLDDLVPSRISKALRGQNATIALLDAISEVLGIPPPVLVAGTPGEAAAMKAARDTTRKREALLAQGKAKLDAIRKKAVAIDRQRGVGLSAHDEDEGRTSGGGSSRRREAGRG